jgi:hypothetical protein
MMMYFRTILLLVFSFTLVSSTTSAQNDTLNCFNANNKKHAYWVQYLDSKLNPTNKENAHYYGYELYDDGERVFKYFKKKWLRDQELRYTGAKTTKGKPILLSGTFKWYNSAGVIINEEIYKAGRPYFIRSYHNSKEGVNTFSEVLYFDKTYNNIEGTYYYEELRDGDQLINAYWFRKGKRGWRVYKIIDP